MDKYILLILGFFIGLSINVAKIIYEIAYSNSLNFFKQSVMSQKNIIKKESVENDVK